MRYVERWWFRIALSMTLAAAVSGGVVPSALAEKGKTAKESYERKCTSCHNDDGTPGKEPARLRTDEQIAELKEICKISDEDEKKLKELRRQPDFTDAEWKKRLEADKKNDYKELLDIIKNGKKIAIKAKCKDEDTGKEKEAELKFNTNMPGIRNLDDAEIKGILDYIGTLEKAKKK